MSRTLINQLRYFAAESRVLGRPLNSVLCSSTARISRVLPPVDRMVANGYH